MTTRRSPLIVVPGTGVDGTARRLEAEGWTVRRDWCLAAEPWDLSGRALVLAGRVDHPDEAAVAVMAAMRGAGLVVAVGPPSEVVDRFLQDLRHLGPVEDRRSAPEPSLAPDQRQLVALLAAGHTLPSAAASMHLSVRTAERRLAAVRLALGARTTAEAVMIARRTGEAGAGAEG